MENLDLPSEIEKLEFVHNQLAEQDDIIHSLDSWYLDFKDYMNDHFYAGDFVCLLFMYGSIETLCFVHRNTRKIS